MIMASRRTIRCQRLTVIWRTMEFQRRTEFWRTKEDRRTIERRRPSLEIAYRLSYNLNCPAVNGSSTSLPTTMMAEKINKHLDSDCQSHLVDVPKAYEQSSVALLPSNSGISTKPHVDAIQAAYNRGFTAGWKAHQQSSVEKESGAADAQSSIKQESATIAPKPSSRKRKQPVDSDSDAPEVITQYDQGVKMIPKAVLAKMNETKQPQAWSLSGGGRASCEMLGKNIREL
ncbi:uncharacterized protein J3D65DRAFT_638352 [Phyllosticta citribraziliensis]|uniref:Uncharacterized protein n=1 Tax=Phyllosticta citribraziliensis TaxID=989973 RepID=A0ABR1LAI4_9PEZI